MQVQGQIIVLEIFGPWNVEQMAAWGNEFGALAAPLCARGPIVSVGVFRGSLLTSPEAITLLGQLTRLGVNHFRLAANAWVVDPSVEGYALAHTIFDSVYSGVVPFEVFDTLEAAMEFVETCRLKKLNDSA